MVCTIVFGHVMHSLDNPTPKRVATVVLSVQGSFFILGTLTGLCGYFLFIANVPDNVIDGFAKNSGFGTLCRVLIICAIAVGAPYSIFMPRVACLALIQLKYPQLVLKVWPELGGICSQLLIMRFYVCHRPLDREYRAISCTCV